MKAIIRSIDPAVAAANRLHAKQSGFYDGRFRPRTHKDKKRELSRNFCRGHMRPER